MVLSSTLEKELSDFQRQWILDDGTSREQRVQGPGVILNRNSNQNQKCHTRRQRWTEIWNPATRLCTEMNWPQTNWQYRAELKLGRIWSGWSTKEIDAQFLQTHSTQFTSTTIIWNSIRSFSRGSRKITRPTTESGQSFIKQIMEDNMLHDCGAV